MQSHGNDKESIIEMLNSYVDSSVLQQELKTASSLVEAPNIDKKPDIQKLTRLLTGVDDMKKRNKEIVKAYDC